MTRRPPGGPGRWPALALAATGLIAISAVALAVPTQAAEQGVGGYCPDDSGVTVVVDFQELGGGIVVRCAPGPLKPGFSGLDALQGAGFSPAGTTRWGLAFICRINNKPAPTQDLKISGNDHYREACVDTPPAAANWGYWYARNGGDWTYSTAGADAHRVIEGGFEGWSFSLNHGSGDNPAPGVAPSRPTPPPTTKQPPTTSSPTSSPPSGNPRPTRTRPPTSSPDPTTSSPTTSSPTTEPAPTSTRPTHKRPDRDTRQKPSAPPPSTAPSPLPATSTAQVSTELPAAASDPDDPGSARSTVLGLGLLAVLAVGAGLTAWWRSRRT